MNSTKTRTCAVCGETKPVENFRVTKRWPDGSARRWHSYCHPCRRAKVRESYARNADRIKAARKAAYRRVKADPVKAEELRTYWREKNRRYLQKMRDERPEDYRAYQRYHRDWWRKRRAEQAKAERRRMLQDRRINVTGRRREQGVREVTGRRSVDEVGEERVPLLPAEPFRAWLEDRLPSYSGPTAMADKLGIDETSVRRVLRGDKPSVSLDTVDRALINEGSTSLDDLYPLTVEGEAA